MENIHLAAKAEFLEKGYKDASLRNIVKSVGMTTGAFYGYYKSKEELFEAIVGEHYEYILNRFIKAQEEFAQLPAARQPEVMSDISGICMYDILHYAYEHLEECKLILCCSEGTKFSGLIDEMVEIEADGTHAYQEVLRQLGRPSPKIDPRLEHILITGMFHTFFELIIHEMPLKDAETDRHTAGADTGPPSAADHRAENPVSPLLLPPGGSARIPDDTGVPFI